MELVSLHLSDAQAKLPGRWRKLDLTRHPTPATRHPPAHLRSSIYHLRLILKLTRHVEGVFSQILQLHMLQRRFVRRLQDHRRSFPRLSRLLPSGGTHAPTVPRFQSWKFVFGPRGGQIVPRHQTELEKFLGHLGANRVTAEIRLVTLTTPRTGKTGQRIDRTHLQGRPQHIPLIVSLRNHLGICRSPATGAIGKHLRTPPSKSKDRRAMACHGRKA